MGYIDLYIGLYSSQISHLPRLSFCNVKSSPVCNQENQTKYCNEWKLGSKVYTVCICCPWSPVAVLVDYDGDGEIKQNKPTNQRWPVPAGDFCCCYCSLLPRPDQCALEWFACAACVSYVKGWACWRVSLAVCKWCTVFPTKKTFFFFFQCTRYCRLPPTQYRTIVIGHRCMP